MENPTKETLEKWHKNPKNWKWGMFYFNKEDKRLFVDKKIQVLVPQLILHIQNRICLLLV